MIRFLFHFDGDLWAAIVIGLVAGFGFWLRARLRSLRRQS